MTKERFETSKMPHLVIRCHGDLQIRSWSEAAVLVKGENCQTTESEDQLSLECSGDLSLTVPAAAIIEVVEVGGDLSAKNVEGTLNLASVTGDAALHNLGSVELGTVHGDLAVRGLNGPFSAGEIMGDTSLRNVAGVTINSVHGDVAIAYANGHVQLKNVMGDVALKTINGDVHISQGQRDLNLRNLGGQIQVDNISGDIRLVGGLKTGKHTLNAQGDIVVRWPAGEPLNVEATAPRVQSRLSNLEKVVEDEGYLSGRLGDGETTLILSAKGRIILKDAEPVAEAWEGADMEFDWDDLGTHIADEINNRFSEFSSKLEGRFGPEFSAEIERKVQQATARAERATAKAVRHAEKLARQAQRHGWSPPPPPSAKERKATEEEQMKILRMVENKVITPEEAETLLEALEN